MKFENIVTRTVALLSFLAVGCATVYQQLETGKLYKRDATVTINGRNYLGVVTVPKAPFYDFIVAPPGAIDLLILRTCHREYVAEKVDPGFLGIGGGKFRYHFVPVPGIEDVRVCPLRIDFFESAGEGRHSWAFIDFEQPDLGYTINAKLTCNGEVNIIRGVATCQNKVGLVQRLEVSEPIQFAPPMPESCAMPKRNGAAYEFTLSAGECLYHFRTQDNRLGRITFIGYTGVLIREGQ